MGVEIGTLVLKGQFGTAPRELQEDALTRAEELEALRRELLREVSDMLNEAKRPHWER